MNLSFDEQMTAIDVTARKLYAELKAAPKDSRKSLANLATLGFMRVFYVDTSAAEFLEKFVLATLETEEGRESIKNISEASIRVVDAGRHSVQKMNQ